MDLEEVGVVSTGVVILIWRVMTIGLKIEYPLVMKIEDVYFGRISYLK